MKLTHETIKAIQPPAAGYLLSWDDEVPGLALRTTAGGVRAFVYNYRTQDGRQRRSTIGRWPALTATAARAEARRLQAQVAGGADPLQSKRERRAAETFAELVDEFATRHLAGKRSGKETERYLRRYALPALGGFKIRDVKRRDIIAVVERKAQTAPIAANRLLSALSRLFNWAIRRDLAEANPCTLVEKQPERSRDRVLTESELKRFWEALPTAESIGPDLKDALRLVLLTMARSGEVCGMRWSEIEGDWWEIPGSRTKNGKAHRIPLNRMALEILDARGRGAEFVFPSGQADHLRAHSLSVAVRRSLDHFEIAPWTPHDLRRSAATHVAGAGVARFTVERLLNHTDRSVSGVYDRATHAREKKAALDAWARRLTAILEGAAKVTAIR